MVRVAAVVLARSERRGEMRKATSGGTLNLILIDIFTIEHLVLIVIYEILFLKV